MQPISLANGLATAAILWNVSFATITFEKFPLTVNARNSYEVRWTSDRDYYIRDFALVHWEDHYSWQSQVETVDHYFNTIAGTDGLRWTVPAVKNDGLYALWISVVALDGKGGILRNETAFATTEDFQIVGGPRLYPKEIAGVVVASVTGLVLLICLVMFGTRWLRKRRSVAVDLGPEEERYTDERA